MAVSPDNRMEYRYQRQAYEISLLLKRGLYYRFVVADSATGAVDATYLRAAISIRKTVTWFLFTTGPWARGTTGLSVANG